jgi:hypothetical protein
LEVRPESRNTLYACNILMVVDLVFYVLFQKTKPYIQWVCPYSIMDINKSYYGTLILWL